MPLDEIDEINLNTLNFQPSLSVRFEEYAYHEQSGRLYCRFKNQAVYRYPCTTVQFTSFEVSESRGRFLDTLSGEKIQ